MGSGVKRGRTSRRPVRPDPSGHATPGPCVLALRMPTSSPDAVAAPDLGRVYPSAARPAAVRCDEEELPVPGSEQSLRGRDSAAGRIGGRHFVAGGVPGEITITVAGPEELAI